MSSLPILISIVIVALAGIFGYLAFLNWKTRAIAREAERLAPATGKTVTVGGERIHYIERGQGPPILLVHGLGGHHHHLRPILEAMDGYRLVSLDRAGSGWSTRGAAASARLTEQAKQLVAFMDAVGLDRPLLVGHSLGGAIALATALDHPDRVSGLALLSPLTHHREDLPPEFRALYIPSPPVRRLVAHTFAVPMSVKNAEKTLAFVFGPQEPPPDYAVAGGGVLGLRPSHFFAAATDIVAIGEDLPRQETRYGELDMPVGILFGDADRVLDYRKHGLSMRDKVAGLDLEILEGVGHMPQYAALDRVTAFVGRMADKAFVTHAGASRRAAE